MPRLSVIVPATDAPPTLERCLRAIAEAGEPPEEVLVIDRPSRIGPAAARNLGARRARGDVIVFVDSDVLVHPDVFARIRRAFASDRELGAFFGAYDAEPEAGGPVSGFRNLLQHHVHCSAAGPIESFWAGLGAVRRDVFVRAGGFDEHRYPVPAIEDIDLGMRLSTAGVRIVLDPALRGTHLKSWTLSGMVATDFWKRGVPWTVLVMERGLAEGGVLNLTMRHRLSAAAAAAALAAGARRRPTNALAAAGLLVLLNRRFYSLLWRRRSPAEAVAGVGLHAVHHLTSVAAAATGVALYIAGEPRVPLHQLEELQALDSFDQNGHVNGDRAQPLAGATR